MDAHDPRLRAIWTQSEIPVVFKQQRPEPLLVRLPFATDNASWLRGSSRRKPVWDGRRKRWETPVSWFDDLILRLLKKYGKTYVVQIHKEQQKCAPACWSATGFHCECSCMGQNHGSGHPGGKWHEVSETFAFSWDERKYACRLLLAAS